MTDTVSPRLKSLFLPRWRPIVWFAFFLSAAYLQTLNFGFSPLDDNMLFLDNFTWFQEIRHLPDLFTGPVSGFYRPILFVTFMWDAVIGNGTSFPFHLTNLVLHFISVVTLFYFFLEIKIQRATAFLLTLFFLIHPVQVQAVAWIPGRNDLLLSIFSVGSILFFLRFSRKGDKKYIIFHFLLYLLALLTKENAIVIPLLIVLSVKLFNLTLSKRLLGKIVAAWVTMTGIWFVIRQIFVSEMSQTDFTHFFRSILTFVQAWIVNTGKMLFPYQQSVLGTMADTSVFPYALILAVFILVLFIGKIVNRSVFILGLAWYTLFLLIPTLWSSFDLLGEFYEHRLYLPLAGVLMMVSQLRLNGKVRKAVPVIIFICLISFFFRTDNRSEIYGDKEAFAMAAIQESPSHYRSYKIYGTVLSEKGEFTAAIQEYNKSEALNPDDETIYYNRGLAQYMLNNFQDAITDFSHAIAIKPEYLDAYNNRGIAYGNLGYYERADQDFNFVIAQDPESYKAYNNLGLNALGREQTDEAILYFSKAIELNHRFEFALNNRGQAYLMSGDIINAIKDFTRAIEVNPYYLTPYAGRAIAFTRLGDTESAARDVNFIKKFQPDFNIDIFLNSSNKDGNSDD